MPAGRTVAGRRRGVPSCPDYPNVTREQADEYEQATAYFCYEQSQAGEIGDHPYTIVDCAYKLTYPMGPLPIPENFQLDDECLQYALAWYRILGHVMFKIYGGAG